MKQLKIFKRNFVVFLFFLITAGSPAAGLPNGGTGWDTMSCIAVPGTYTQFQNETIDDFSDNMEEFGIFDQTEKKNTFLDWGFVYT